MRELDALLLVLRFSKVTSELVLSVGEILGTFRFTLMEILGTNRAAEVVDRMNFPMLAFPLASKFLSQSNHLEDIRSGWEASFPRLLQQSIVIHF